MTDSTDETMSRLRDLPLSDGLSRFVFERRCSHSDDVATDLLVALLQRDHRAEKGVVVRHLVPCNGDGAGDSFLPGVHHVRGLQVPGLNEMLVDDTDTVSGHAYR